MKFYDKEVEADYNHVNPLSKSRTAWEAETKRLKVTTLYDHPVIDKFSRFMTAPVYMAFYEDKKGRIDRTILMSKMVRYSDDFVVDQDRDVLYAVYEGSDENGKYVSIRYATAKFKLV